MSSSTRVIDDSDNELLSLVIFDIDRFSEINNTYGRRNGDAVLAAIAESAQKELRSYDVVARYGEAKFVFVLPGTPISGGVVVGERLRKTIQSLIFAPPMDLLSVKISLGVATYPSPAVDSITSLFRQADYALSQTKQKRRHRMKIADDNSSLSV